MTSAIDIRRATPHDASMMAELLTQLGYATASDELPRRLATIDGEGGVVFVTRDTDERITGLASGARLATLHADGHVAYITALVIASDARGRGVGRALVAAVEEWARAQGCTRLSVTSAEHRADAHEFYPRCGLPYSGRRFSRSLEPSQVK